MREPVRKTIPIAGQPASRPQPAAAATLRMDGRHQGGTKHAARRTPNKRAHRQMSDLEVDEDHIGSLNFGDDSPNDALANLSSASAHPGIGAGGTGGLVRDPGRGSRRDDAADGVRQSACLEDLVHDLGAGGDDWP